MRLRFLSIFFLLFIVQYSNFAQSGQSNPFDLKHRLDNQDLPETKEAESAPNPEESTTDIESSEKPVDKDNPFEITGKASVKVDKAPIETPKVVLPKAKKSDRISSNALFWILIFLTLLFAVIINLNRIIISHLLKAWTNLNFSNLLLRDKKGPDQLLYVLLAIIFYFNAGLLLGVALDRFYNIPLTTSRLFIYTGAIIGIYVIRHLSLYWLAQIFSIGKEVRQYSFTIHIFNILNGVLLLIANYIIVFSPENFGNIVLYIVLLVLAIQFLYRNIRGLLLSAKYIVGDRVHFFLYLCTCEIVPWILCFVTISRLG